MKSVRIYHPDKPDQGTLLIPEQYLAVRRSLGWQVVKENEAPKVRSRKK